MQFFETIRKFPEHKEEAVKLAEERLKQKQKGQVWQGYHLGDIELIDVKEKL